MAVGMLVRIPGGTQELYDSIDEHLGWDGKEYPPGFISHYAGPTADGWLVFDVWESQEDFERFAQEDLGPAVAAATGWQAPEMTPTFIPIYNQDHAGARV